MKIAIIEPRGSEANVYSRFPMPLLGPVYLGTILKNRGHQVTIYKEDVFTPDYSSIDADVVGISILTSTARRGYEIAAMFPREKVVLGGVHASLLPEEAVEHARQVVVGEAEDVIVDVMEGRRTERIVKGNPVKDLDALPFPDFSLIKGYQSNAAITPISTSRGCPFDCSFCSVTKMFGREYRFRSSGNIRQELSSRQGKAFFFCDDNFTANPKRAHELLAILRHDKIRNWACQVRCDVTKNEPLLKSMARAGCKVVCVGFESVNYKTLQAYDKRQTIDEIIHAIKSFHKKHISIHGMFVLGGDDDTIKTVKETVRFALKHQIDTIQMMILTPFPGTKVHQDLSQQKRIFSTDWKLYDGQHIVFNPKLVSAKELQMSVLKAYKNFYSLSNSVSLLLRLRFRNAFLRLMGHSIVKEWAGRNRGMEWLT